MEEIKGDSFSLTDYQTVTTALLFGCFHGPVSILTADRDIVDIKDNLYNSIIERFAINEFLTKHYSSRLTLPPTIELSFDEIENIVLDILKRIDSSTDFIYLLVFLYRADNNKIFTYPMKIPKWLRNFILECKKNVDCYSLPFQIDQLYPIKYIMDPDLANRRVTYRVFGRPYMQFKSCLPSCFDYCRYVKKEREDPSSLSDFL